ncbi:MAG: hypothetical protein Aurels2KO_48530 [Aureliella sp.]
MTRRKPDKKSAPEEPDRSTAKQIRFAASHRRIASSLIVVQICVLILSLSSNLSPSTLQGNLLDWAELYTITTAQDYGAVPIELTHGETLDFPVAVQVQSDSDGRDEWTTLELPGVNFTSERPVDWSRSRWANLSRAVRLLYNDTADPEAIAILASAATNGSTSRVVGDVRRVRVVSPTVVSYRQYESVKEANLTVAEAFTDEVIYTAELVKLPSGEQVLIPEEESLRTSKSKLLDEVAP